MKNETLATWLNVTAVASLLLAFLGSNEDLLGVVAIGVYVFAFMAAHRLNNLE